MSNGLKVSSPSLLSTAQHLLFYVVLLFIFPLTKGCFRIAKAEDSLGGKNQPRRSFGKKSDANF